MFKRKFTGNPLKNTINTEVNIFTGQFSQEVLQEYQERIKKEYRENANLDILSYDRKSETVIGSNPYAVVLMNNILAQEVLQTATQADLEKILKLNAPLLRNHYIDSALVLRSIDEPNEYLARRLTTQLRGLELPYGFSSREQKLKLPVMISLKDLELEIDQYSPSGLAFTLKEAAQPIYAPILNQEGRFFSEDINKQTGLPTKTEKKGNRTLWVHYKTGLCGLCLSRNSDIGSSGHDLHSSDNNGLIVVLSTITTEGM